MQVEGKQLVATLEFPTAELSPFGDQVYQLVKAGYLNAASVGFLPTKWSFSDDPGRRLGIDFEEQELLEFSIVSVPANAGALALPAETNGPSESESAPPASKSSSAARRLKLLGMRCPERARQA